MFVYLNEVLISYRGNKKKASFGELVIYSVSLSVLNELSGNGTKYMRKVCSDLLFHLVKEYLEWFVNANMQISK